MRNLNDKLDDRNSLFSRATQACYDYKKVFGAFPPKIGLHYERRKSFPYDSINVPEMPTIRPCELNNDEPPSIMLRRILVEQVMGKIVQ